MLGISIGLVLVSCHWSLLEAKRPLKLTGLSLEEIVRLASGCLGGAVFRAYDPRTHGPNR